jgi:transposase InsO family protein
MAQRFRLHHVCAVRRSGLSLRAYCRQPAMPHRNSLGRWARTHRAQGPQALLSGTPRRCPHNRTCLQDEARILQHVKYNPGHGPQRIANELRDAIGVGHTGVYGVLQRHGLNTRRAREEWARQQLGEIVTKSELETARQKAKHRHFQVTYPGECWGQDTFLIGCLKGIGLIYHHLAVDLASSYGVVTIYTARTAENACNFLRNHLVPKAKNLGVHRLVQDNGTEFTAARWRDAHGQCNHPFHEAAAELGIELTFIKPGHAFTNGCCERLHQTLLHEFYIPQFTQKTYTSLEELQYDLQLFMQWYNYRRTHQGHRLKGQVPAQVYLSGKTNSPTLTFQVVSF